MLIPERVLFLIVLSAIWTSESMLVRPIPRLFWIVMLVRSTRELSLISAPRPPSKVMFWIPTLCEAAMASRCPLAFPGTTVAVGLPKMVRSVRPNMTTFSWQVPVTEMLFGPAAGSDASAAWMLVKAPGVAPLQYTMALSAKARLEIRSNKQPNNSFYPEQLVIVILTLLKFEFGGLQQIAPANLVVRIIEESLQKNHRKVTLKG